MFSKKTLVCKELYFIDNQLKYSSVRSFTSFVFVIRGFLRGNRRENCDKYGKKKQLIGENHMQV